jgi:hypothetical protein
VARPRGQAPNPIVLDKERQVVALRRAGLIWADIANQVGYSSPSGASEAFYRASYRVVKEDIETLRELENERLDYLFAAVWERALAGDNQATETCLKIMSRRSKLLGLDRKPETRQETAQTYDVDSIQYELQRFIKERNVIEELGIDVESDDYAETIARLKRANLEGNT